MNRTRIKAEPQRPYFCNHCGAVLEKTSTGAYYAVDEKTGAVLPFCNPTCASAYEAATKETA